MNCKAGNKKDEIKFIKLCDDRHELYCLKDDPDEMRNLIKHSNQNILDKLCSILKN